MIYLFIILLFSYVVVGFMASSGIVYYITAIFFYNFRVYFFCSFSRIIITFECLLMVTLKNIVSAPPPPLQVGTFSRGVVTMRCDLTTCSCTHISILLSGSAQTCFDDQVIILKHFTWNTCHSGSKQSVS